MKECTNPVYYVIYTIANHSKKLFRILTDWQDELNEPDNDDPIVITTVANTHQNVDDLCLCASSPAPGSTTESIMQN